MDKNHTQIGEHMNNKHTWFNVLTIFITVILSGCTPPSSNNKDPFYRSIGDYDFNRLPLIEPYDAITLTGASKKSAWQIDLHPSTASTKTYYSEISDVRKLSVNKGVIMAYTPYFKQYLKDQGLKNLYWFVIVPSKKVEIGFDNETDFHKYIQSIGIEEPVWIEPDPAFRQFEKTGCLDWIPDCK
jgi:hypothetical protein